MRAKLIVVFMMLAVASSAPRQNQDAESAEPILPGQVSRNIERFRKADAALRFITPSGAGLGDALVEVRQTSHDFLFGNYIRYIHFTGRTFRHRFKELFNFATLLEFNWGQYETVEGQPKLTERMEIADWCSTNNINTMGHMLVWTAHTTGGPRPSHIPSWLWKYDEATKYKLLERRVKKVVQDFTGKVDTWVVVNEPASCRVWGDWEEQSWLGNPHRVPIENVVPYVKDSLRWAHQAHPKATLLLNDYHLIDDTSRRKRFRRLVEALKAEGAPISALGIQAHEERYSWYSPQQLWETYDELGSLGYPLYITEFTVSSSDQKKIVGKYRRGYWNEDLQAECAEQFYRLSFGHPAVRCIVWFGLADHTCWLPESGVLDKEYRPKKVWHVLKRLIHEEWTTKTSGRTSPDGAFRFRGFCGRHEVLIHAANGKVLTYRIHVQKNKPNTWTFEVR